MLASRFPLWLAALVLVGGCDRERKAEEANVIAPPAERVEPVEQPAVVKPLTRRDILLAVAEAQSSYAARTNDGEQQQALDGRPFTFRIRLCGALNDDFQASFDEEEQTLRVSVRPNLTAESLRVGGLIADGRESVEGFWIPRPWLLQATCPAGASAPAPRSDDRERSAAPVPSTIGIAQFGAEDRAQSILRGDRAYEITRKLDEGAAAGPVDLVLEGRLRRLPGGKVISCAGDAILQPPTCVVSAEFDKVRLEQPGGELLAEWSEG